jgi:hypothetical protein
VSFNSSNSLQLLCGIMKEDDETGIDVRRIGGL